MAEGSTFSRYPGSQIYLPESLAQKARVNHIDRYAFVMDYAPGRSKHRDPDVVNVNDALRNLNDASPIQKVFAAILPSDKPFGTVFGLTIWITEDVGHCQMLGNVANEKAGDQWRGVGDVKRIMHWLTATNMLTDGNKNSAADFMKFYEEHNARIKKDAADKSFQIAAESAQETLKYIRDRVPLHNGQIVSRPDPAVEAMKKAEREEAKFDKADAPIDTKTTIISAPEPAPAPVPDPPKANPKRGKRGKK